MNGRDESDNRPVLAFTGGGSGGHVYPGLAVAERVRKLLASGAVPGRGPEVFRLVWIGSGKEIERRAVEAAGLEFFAIPSGKLRRSFSPRNLLDAFKVAAGFVAARRLLKRLRPFALFSKGGYVSVPPCRAAAGLGIPVLTHESDVTPGLATRLVLGSAARVFVSYEKTKELLPASVRPRVSVVGNPIREAIGRGDPERGRAFVGAPPGLPVVLFLGGSQGARQVNELAAESLKSLAGRAYVVHQYGDGLKPAAPQDPLIAGGYRAFPYIRAEMPDVMAAADIIVGRAGAGTVWESAVSGKAMVLVPLCGVGTRGDQVDNARNAESAGAAVALVGAEATGAALAGAIRRLIDEPAERGRMAAAARAMVPGDAALSIARELLTLAPRRDGA